MPSLHGTNTLGMVTFFVGLRVLGCPQTTALERRVTCENSQTLIHITRHGGEEMITIFFFFFGDTDAK